MSRVERWLALTVRGPAGEGAELLPEGLVLLGGRAVEEGPEGYTTYLPPPPNLPEFLRRARALLLDHARLSELEISWRWQEQRAWDELWKRGLGPRRVTGRILVTPTWKEPRIAPGDVVVRLDPGMAFGTAEHATTRSCLRLMDPVLRTGDRILDVGAGSGILAIAAARLGAASVVTVESDPYACETARANVRANAVEDVVTVLERKAGPTTLSDLKVFDGVLANLETPLLLPLLAPLREVLKPGGWLVLSGIGASEKGAVLQELGHLGLILDDDDEEDEWWGVRARSVGSGERSAPP